MGDYTKKAQKVIDDLTAQLEVMTALCSRATKEVERLKVELEKIATTTKGYPNASREGEIARAALGEKEI